MDSAGCLRLEQDLDFFIDLDFDRTRDFFVDFFDNFRLDDLETLLFVVLKSRDLDCFILMGEYTRPLFVM